MLLVKAGKLRAPGWPVFESFENFGHFGKNVEIQSFQNFGWPDFENFGFRRFSKVFKIFGGRVLDFNVFPKFSKFSVAGF